LFFFNLSLPEFLALFTAASAVVVALYLLDRSRRQNTVFALRFWNAARKPVESTSRRRIRQWPSLLLQLASIACLLLAISQLRIGSPDTSSRDHVLLIDTSSWMAATDAGAPLIEQARRQALAYVKVIPPTDRVMVAYADTMATPATAFEMNRRKVEEAIRAARPGNAALDLGTAFDFARRAQSRGAKRSGEIVFAGAGRQIQRDGSGGFEAPANLRVLAVSGAPENTGIRKIGLRRSTSEPDLWHIFISVRNYGRAANPTDLAIQFGGSPSGSRQLRVAPGAETEASFELRTRAAGMLEARIRTRGDAFPADDRALLELPPQPAVPVVVCGADPALLKPLLDSHPFVQATYKPGPQCPQEPADAIVVADRVLPNPMPKRVVLLDPPAGAPLAATPNYAAVTLDRWTTGHPIAAGLHTRDFRIEAARTLQLGSGDSAIASSSVGPVIGARPGLVVFGFHPMRSALRYELATPLLFANILRWLAPDSLRIAGVYASAAGSVTVPLGSEAETAKVEVKGDDGVVLPHSVHGQSIRFFSAKPGTVRVRTAEREQVFSMTLPDVPESLWTAPSTARRGVPRAREWGSSSRDIWYWLAILGGLGLLIEWLLFAPAGPRGAPVLQAPGRPAEEAPLRRSA